MSRHPRGLKSCTQFQQKPAGGLERRLKAGFTLIELMVAVAVIAIIVAIAIPSYQGYISDGYRNQAAVDAKVCALALERFYSEGFTYVGGDSQCETNSPTNGTAHYTLSVSTSVSSYTITATPVAGGSCADASVDCVQLDRDGTQTIL
jgi:type IV pilus assembly protein PilE